MTLTSSVNITSGAALCRNMQPVVFTCTAVDVSFLSWQRNGEEIEPNFNIGDMPRRVASGLYTLFLNEIHVSQLRQLQVANMTSRLVVNLTDLVDGDKVTCKELVAQDSINLHYKIRGICSIERAIMSTSCIYLLNLSRQ